MNQTEIKIFAALSIVIGAGVWLLFYTLNTFDVTSFESLKALNVGITATGIFWFIYFKWAWKWPYIRKILYRPNVNGTWLGEFKSDWKDENGSENPPGKFVLVVRQYWFSVSVRGFTERQRTESYVETIMSDDAKGIRLLAYLYSEKKVGTGDHGVRQGAAELDLIEADEERSLEGHFWTQAGTRGYLRVGQAACSDYIESYEQAKNKWITPNLWLSISEQQG